MKEQQQPIMNVSTACNELSYEQLEVIVQIDIDERSNVQLRSILQGRGSEVEIKTVVRAEPWSGSEDQRSLMKTTTNMRVYIAHETLFIVIKIRRLQPSLR
jgi:hypothetical protein